MSGRRPKRPSSARRTIKQETFSTFVSQNRLCRIQATLRGGAHAPVSAPDSLLCILGIDSRYNDGCREFANYLLFGFFDLRRQELESSGFPEETIDDLMIVVRNDGVEVYCNPINYLYLLPYIVHWRNLRVHCLGEQEYEADDDKAEEFKIQSLVAMTDGADAIAMPFTSASGQTVTFNKMIIEKWPIIQAYALEGYGGGMFFTLKYEVADYSKQLQDVYEMQDPVSMETMLTENLVKFEKQWKSLVSNLQLAGIENIPQQTERSLCEPFESYYQYGQVNSNKSTTGKLTRRPFVFIGRNSCRANMEETSMTGSGDVHVEATGLDGDVALHMVCQAVSPRSPITCTRTYFFSASHTPYSGDESADKDIAASDIGLLSGIYRACVDSLLEAIKAYGDTRSTKTAEATATHGLMHWFQERSPSVGAHITHKKAIEFSLKAYDSHNCAKSAETEEGALWLKTATLTVYDIPSIEHDGKALGSVCFSETFMDSAIHVQAPDGSSSTDREMVVLTSKVPRFMHWPVHRRSLEVVSKIEERLKSQTVGFGRLLVSGDRVHLLTPTAPEMLYEGQTFLYEEGIVYLHPHAGAILLPKDNIQAIYFYDGDSPSVVTLLLLSLSKSLWRHLPTQLQPLGDQNSHQVALAFLPKTKAFKELFHEVLPLWRQESQALPMQLLMELPDEWQTTHQQVQVEFDLESAAYNSALKKREALLPGLKSFLSHFAVSSITKTTAVHSRDVSAVLQLPFDSGSFGDSDETLVVTIIGGLPGSHKEELCDHLVRLAKDNNRWAVLRHPVDSTEEFSINNIQHHLATTLNTFRQNQSRVNSPTKQMRALIVTPGYTDIVDVVQAITTFPDKDIARRLKIGAVTMCIEPHNFNMEHRYTLPHLMEQCALGWVNNIIFTGNNTQDEALIEAQSLVRAVNSNVALLLAEKGAVTRSPDIDLILSSSAFQDGELLRARYLSCPGWIQGTFKTGRLRPVIDDIVLRFSQPLDRSKLLNQLKVREFNKQLHRAASGVRTSHKAYPFSGNIYFMRGKLLFTDSPKVYNFTHTVPTGHTSLMPSDVPLSTSVVNGDGAHKPYCIIFSGCGLSEETLKSWLRGCTQPKPHKKVLRTRQSISKTEIKKIHCDRHLEGLPNGWFYNGSQFLCLDGSKSDTHPDLERFIIDYLQTVNKDVEAHNKRLEQTTFHDLFE